jgi:hypothetical protein
MQLKVFEINTESYYRRNNFEAFASDINLDGLIASLEKAHYYKKYPSHQKHVETVVLESDPQAGRRSKRGLFVIEFIGNGISSRAIV